MDWDAVIGIGVLICSVIAFRVARIRLRRRRIKGLMNQARPQVSDYLDSVYHDAHSGRSGDGVVALVERLMEACHQNIPAVVYLYAQWHDDRRASKEAVGDRAGMETMDALQLQIALNGMGNLFGLIPDEAPAFDPELALEGISRGWRVTGGPLPQGLEAWTG